MFSGHSLEFGCTDVGPCQAIVDLAVGVAVDDPGEQVGEVAERLDSIQFADFDQGGDDGSVLCAAVRSSESVFFR